MTMTEPTTTPSGSEYRVVTVADLRHELQRERLITDAQLQTISNQVAALDSRFGDFREVIERRFAEAKDNMNQQITAVDQRFAEAKTKTDQRFDQMEKLFVQVGRRFDALDERLRFNKTLVVASISAVASAASVVVSLLR